MNDVVYYNKIKENGSLKLRFAINTIFVCLSFIAFSFIINSDLLKIFTFIHIFFLIYMTFIFGFRFNLIILILIMTFDESYNNMIYGSNLLAYVVCCILMINLKRSHFMKRINNHYFIFLLNVFFYLFVRNELSAAFDFNYIETKFFIYEMIFSLVCFKFFDMFVRKFLSKQKVIL